LVLNIFLRVLSLLIHVRCPAHASLLALTFWHRNLTFKF
jgi:hypothetical protein